MIGFDSLSYEVSTKNEPDVPIIKFHSIPDYYDRDMFFPIGVIIREGAEGDTAIGKSCMNCMYICVEQRSYKQLNKVGDSTDITYLNFIIIVTTYSYCCINATLPQ